MTAAGLVRAPVTVLRHDSEGIRTVTQCRADEPLFAGHYPAFPIFPGVALVECVHHSVLAAARLRNQQAELRSVESARFRSPAFPGDELVTELAITDSGGRWRCAARISHDRAEVASVVLVYRAGASA